MARTSVMHALKQLAAEHTAAHAAGPARRRRTGPEPPRPAGARRGPRPRHRRGRRRRRRPRPRRDAAGRQEAADRQPPGRRRRRGHRRPDRRPHPQGRRHRLHRPRGQPHTGRRPHVDPARPLGLRPDLRDRRRADRHQPQEDPRTVPPLRPADRGLSRRRTQRSRRSPLVRRRLLPPCPGRRGLQGRLPGAAPRSAGRGRSQLELHHSHRHGPRRHVPVPVDRDPGPRRPHLTPRPVHRRRLQRRVRRRHRRPVRPRPGPPHGLPAQPRPLQRLGPVQRALPHHRRQRPASPRHRTDPAGEAPC